MRVDIDLTDDDRKRVKAYADEHGLKMSRAYANLIRSGLNADNNTQD